MPHPTINNDWSLIDLTNNNAFELLWISRHSSKIPLKFDDFHFDFHGFQMVRNIEKTLLKLGIFATYLAKTELEEA